MNKWDLRFIEQAKLIASWSKDSTKIGAVLVVDRQIISTGYNGIARGVNDTIASRNSRENNEKYLWAGHAERNSIYNAARYGIRTMGSTMYLNCGHPCTICAIAIINSGVTELVCEANMKSPNMAKWHGEVQRAKVMFVEAGVVTRYYEGE